MRAFDWCQNEWPWMTLKYHYASVSKHVRLSELTVKIWMKIDLYCQRQRCSQMTLVSANIRCVPIFEGVHWREGVKRQWGTRKHGFSQLSTLRLKHVKKWDKCYYILLGLFNPLSPFHWPRWPWLTEWLECSLYVTVLRFAILPSVIFFLLIYCRVCLGSGTREYIGGVRRTPPIYSLAARHVTYIEVREVQFRIVIRRIFGIGETLHRRDVNNYRQNYDIVLVLHCISTDS